MYAFKVRYRRKTADGNITTRNNKRKLIAENDLHRTVLTRSRKDVKIQNIYLSTVQFIKNVNERIYLKYKKRNGHKVTVSF